MKGAITFAERRRRARYTGGRGRPERGKIVGFLPPVGYVEPTSPIQQRASYRDKPNRGWVGRLLDLYDLAHLQLVHGTKLTAEVYVQVHPMKGQASGRKSANFSNCWHPIDRLLTFARKIGIDVWTERDHHDAWAYTSDPLVIVFADPEAAQKKCNRLLDKLAKKPCKHQHQDQDNDDRLAGQPDEGTSRIAA